jgi:hypothetical protein
MTPAEPPSAETSPQSAWECSLVWVDLMIGRHVESLEQVRHGQLFKFSEEETALYAGVDRPLVSFLIAAVPCTSGSWDWTSRSPTRCSCRSLLRTRRA